MRLLFASVRLLFVPSFVESDRAGLPEASSDSVGYGATSSRALISALESQGYEITVAAVTAEVRGTEWVPAVLQALHDRLSRRVPDAVLSFHAFSPFAADVRRMLDDLHIQVPFVAYTHGSHWDPTDLFRSERYPSLRWADLGNLLAADRVLTPSEYLRETISANVARVCRDAAVDLEGRLRVVGLPIDSARLERTRRPKDSTPPTVLFNHAMIPAKRPEAFLRILPELFRASDCRVVMTRASLASERYGAPLSHLVARFPDRLIVGGHLRLDEYYATLWESSVQVSTASHEAFGVATLEAMATHNYCCLPRIGSYPELVAGVTQTLYESDEELPGKILSAFGDDEGLSATAAALAGRARDFSPETVAGHVSRVISEVAS